MKVISLVLHELFSWKNHRVLLCSEYSDRGNLQKIVGTVLSHESCSQNKISYADHYE